MIGSSAGLEHLFYADPGLFVQIAISTLMIIIGGVLGLYIRWRPQKGKSYQDRLKQLAENLNKSSSEFDEILREMFYVAKEREEAVRKMETTLVDLENKEKEVKDRIDHLQNIPIPAADHIAKLMEPEGKASARRDYALFFSGFLLSTAVSIFLEIYFQAP